MYNVKWRTYSNINYETIVILCNWGDGLKNVSPSHKFYLLPFYCLNNMNHICKIRNFSEPTLNFSILPVLFICVFLQALKNYPNSLTNFLLYNMNLKSINTAQNTYQIYHHIISFGILSLLYFCSDQLLLFDTHRAYYIPNK